MWLHGIEVLNPNNTVRIGGKVPAKQWLEPIFLVGSDEQLRVRCRRRKFFHEAVQVRCVEAL